MSDSSTRYREATLPVIGSELSAVELSPKDRQLVSEERQLIDRCLRGDSLAWRRLYGQCQGPLTASIKAQLRAVRPDASLVDEIAARVWYLLVQNNFELLDRFDVTRGCRLITFLSMLARTQSRSFFRSEKRRRVREREAYRSEILPPLEAVPCEGNLSEQEFVSTLTSAERVFYEQVLVPRANSSGATYGAPETSQLRHRIKKKLHHFLRSGETTAGSRPKFW